jgi:hypothetical protein
MTLGCLLLSLTTPDLPASRQIDRAAALLVGTKIDEGDDGLTSKNDGFPSNRVRATLGKEPKIFASGSRLIANCCSKGIGGQSKSSGFPVPAW